MSSFESLSNYNHYIRWYDDTTDGAENHHMVNCEVCMNHKLHVLEFYVVVLLAKKYRTAKRQEILLGSETC